MTVVVLLWLTSLKNLQLGLKYILMVSFGPVLTVLWLWQQKSQSTKGQWILQRAYRAVLLIVYLSFCCLTFIQSISVSVVFSLLGFPIIGPVGAVDSGQWAGSAPHSTEVMCLPWRCPAVPGEQWLRAGITSGLSDPGCSCQDKQHWYWKSRDGGSAGCFRFSHRVSHLHA